MTTTSNHRSPIRRLAVIGAGNMGSGIAQKMATEGFPVTLVDLADDQVQRGLKIIDETLQAGIERRIFKEPQVEQIRGRIRGTTDWGELADVDLVVEAVFEDLEVKRQVFARLEEVCRADAILATNTSSFSVTELADGARHPERIVGLHYFYHPAKNRLVEVVPGRASDAGAVAAAWLLQEQIGKTPIASADASGFVVNRYFVPWLNEAVRLVEEQVADIPTIEQACKKSFGVGMGPFELMNVTGVPIAQHAATTLGRQFGPLYEPTNRLRSQVESGRPWNLDGQADESKIDTIAERMQAVVFFVAGSLVDEEVSTVEDTDIGARVGLRWPRGPFQMMNRIGVERAAAMARAAAERWELPSPRVVEAQAKRGRPFEFRLVNSEITDGIATLTINRPDAMNALNEAVVEQLHEAFRVAAADTGVRGIVIAGAGKAFIAGADIRFFVRNIDAGKLDRIVSFTRAGHALLNDIDRCDKTVVARMHGLALGGGLELALACDLLVGSPKASFAFPETGIGIYPGLGGTQRLRRRVGTGVAKWLIYTGQMLTAERALGVGLLDAVAPHDELDERIRTMIETGTRRPSSDAAAQPSALDRLFDTHPVDELCSGEIDTGDDPAVARALKQVGFKAPIALRLAERLIDEGAGRSLDDGLQLELDHLIEIFGTADAYEGLTSLGRKRPEFQGR